MKPPTFRFLGYAVRSRVVRLGFAIGLRRPLRSRVVLATGHADALGGNLAIIAERLTAREPGVEVRTLTTFPRRTIRGRIAVLWQTFVAGYLLATSRLFVVDDYFYPIYPVPRRRGTLIVQVWHGCGALKKFGYSVLDKAFGADAETTDRYPIHTNYDVCLVSGQSVAPYYADAFHQPVAIFRSDLGIPRTDVLFGDERRAITVDRLRHRYGIPADRRVVLYAPTFRGTTASAARYEPSLDLPTMFEALGADHVLLIRQHPFIRAGAPIPDDLRAFAIDVSDHRDINELLLVADVLVTDYSSVIFEFALLGRPILLFAPDLAAYEEERGFYYDYTTGVPGPIFETTGALAAALRAGSFDVDRVVRFAKANFDVADGHATDRFIDEIVLPALARAD